MARVVTSRRRCDPIEGLASAVGASFFAALAACAGSPKVPVARASARTAGAPPPVAEILAIRAPGSPQLAPDGSLYVRDWPDGVNQLYRIAPGASAIRCTDFADGLSSYSISPDGRRIVLAAARGGNEQDQLSLYEPARTGVAGRGTPILENPEAVFRIEHWLQDGSSFFYAANDASASDFHLYRYDFEGGEGAGGRSTKLLSEPGSWSVQDAALDGSRVLVAHFVSESESHAFELDTISGKLERVFVPERLEATTNDAPIGFLPGEQAVVFTSDSGGLTRVWVYDLDHATARRPIVALDRFEVDTASIDSARELLAVVTNEEGYGVLHVYRLPSFEEVALPPIERGVVTLAQVERGTVVWTLSNARTPGLSYAYDVPRAGARDGGPLRARAITSADTRGIDLSRFALPELVRYRSFDGHEIPAFLYLPPGAARGAPIPFVVHFHGGPEGQHRPGFDRTVQVLLSRGIGVLQPNVRGSTGYGREFHRLDDVRQRLDSVKDGVEAARWLVREGFAEKGRIAAYGGSYGGFMSVATILEGPDVFGAAIDVVGIVNFETFLEQTKGYRRKLREAEYGALTDREFLRSISPLHRAREIEIPMLIAHGLNDPRVPVGEALQLAVSLQGRGHDPELVLFPDEGHGFQKLENRRIFTEKMVRFLERTIARPRGTAATNQS